MDDNEFWIRVWRLLIAGSMCLVVTVASCTQVSNYQERLVIQAGVAAGKSALEMKCAWLGSVSQTNECLLLYAKP